MTVPYFFLYSFPESLKKRLLGAYKLDNVKSIAWGVNHEDSAVKAYCDLGGTVERTGID